MYRIDEIEDAIITQLTAAEIGCRVETLPEILGGEIDSEIYDRMALKFPAIFVCFSGARTETDQPQDGTARRSEFTTLVCARSLRGASDAAHKNLGAYEILDAMRVCLQNNDLGLDGSTLSEDMCDIAARRSTGVIYSVTWQFEEII